jgi:hypothetical protein
VAGRPGFEAAHQEETTLRGRRVVDHAREEVEDEHHPADPSPLFLVFVLRGVVVEVAGDVVGRVEGAEA